LDIVDNILQQPWLLILNPGVCFLCVCILYLLFSECLFGICH
jgi:hypothetical protein